MMSGRQIIYTLREHNLIHLIQPKTMCRMPVVLLLAANSYILVHRDGTQM